MSRFILNYKYINNNAPNLRPTKSGGKPVHSFTNKKRDGTSPSPKHELKFYSLNFYDPAFRSFNLSALNSCKDSVEFFCNRSYFLSFSIEGVKLAFVLDSADR